MKKLMTKQEISSLVVGQNGIITAGQFRELTKSAMALHSACAKSEPTTSVLDSLLSRVKPVDFHVISEVANTTDLKQMHLVVSTIEEVMKLAKKENWDLCVHNGKVYAFNRRYWKLISEAEFKSFLGKVALKMGMQAVKAKYYVVQDQLFKQFMAAATLPKLKRQKDMVLINLKNGTMEFSPQGSRLRECRAEDFLTYVLPFGFDKNASAPKFKGYLDRVVPNPLVQLSLAEFLGYLFAKHLKLEKCLLLKGSGANGKSVFFEIVNGLLGPENVSNFSLANLNEEHNRALIADKLLNYGTEINSGIQRDVFKGLVSGEPVQARLKYHNSITITDYARLCFNCNELPADVEHSEAFFRRFLIVPFDVTIPEGERDSQLAQTIISEELSGVFNWVLNGLDSLMKNKRFTENKEVQQALTSYKLESDSVYQFLEDAGYEKSTEQATSYKFFYDEYAIFCKDSGYRAVSKQRMTKRLNHHGFLVERRGAGGNMHVFVQRKVF